MPFLPVSLANLLLMFSCSANALFWKRSTGAAAATQREILQDILRRNCRTQFGREHQFESIRSVAQYQATVSITSYADYKPYLERIAQGQKHILVADDLLSLATTSGSTSATKLIPYSARLIRDFRRGIDPWIFGLFRRFPSMLWGRAYWQITPVAQKPAWTAGGIRIGFGEDSEYFGGCRRAMIRRTLAVPEAVAQIPDISAFRYTTLRFLLQCRDLRFVSVWNPSFLTLLLQSLLPWVPRLIQDIRCGQLSPPCALPSNCEERLARSLERSEERAEELEAICGDWAGKRPEQENGSGQTLYEAIWPRLKVISSWTGAYAAEPAFQLKTLFPHVHLQPKGLIATEGFVTFPWGAGAVPFRCGRIFTSLRSKRVSAQPLPSGWPTNWSLAAGIR